MISKRGNDMIRFVFWIDGSGGRDGWGGGEKLTGVIAV